MSEFATHLMYFIVIALAGVVMIVSPRTFIGKAKFDEDSIKAEKFIRGVGIGIIIIGLIFTVISIIYKS